MYQREFIIRKKVEQKKNKFNIREVSVQAVNRKFKKNRKNKVNAYMKAEDIGVTHRKSFRQESFQRL